MHHIEIRRPKIEDSAELHELFSEVITDTFRKEGLSDMVNDIQIEIESKRQYLKCDLNSSGKDRFFWLGIDTCTNKIIGCIEYGPASELITACTKGELQEWIEIGTVFVHSKYQRKGVGTLLLHVMLLTLQSREIKNICLDSGYKNAQKVWKKLFGNPHYLLKDYWSKGYHHMIWKISTERISIVFKPSHNK
ncbi:GNAT family N-acetyltransferase [Priestia aryabhattai]|uniref:GNAT family N-acetyltransferase n=1 Tax=Priestia megaterium TaxID=1404 RepID=UPI0039B86E8A